jgi:hypothetical protein
MVPRLILRKNTRITCSFVEGSLPFCVGKQFWCGLRQALFLATWRNGSGGRRKGPGARGRGIYKTYYYTPKFDRGFRIGRCRGRCNGGLRVCSKWCTCIHMYKSDGASSVTTVHKNTDISVFRRGQHGHTGTGFSPLDWIHSVQPGC